LGTPETPEIDKAKESVKLLLEKSFLLFSCFKLQSIRQIIFITSQEDKLARDKLIVNLGGNIIAFL